MTVRVIGEATEEAVKEIRNKVTVESPSHPVDPEQCEVNDDVDADTDQCDEVVVSNGLSLKVDKKLEGPDTVKPGDEVKYFITAKNASEKTEDGTLTYTRAKDVIVKDLAGEGLDGIKLVNPSKGDVDGENWDIGELAPGETVTIEVTGVISKDGEGGVINTATIGNTVLPAPEGGECEANEDVDGDNDQCDNVSVNVAPEVPEDPSKPGDPSKPELGKKPDPAVQSGGEVNPGLPLAAAGGLLIAAVGTSALLWRRSRR